MIKLTLTTVMEFRDERDLMRYVNSREVHSITGFPGEICEAYNTGKCVIVKTPRPEYGAVTRSDISVLEQTNG